MSNPTTVVEGCLKYRDGRKWKSRWALITKLSPVADCLHLQIYRDSKDRCKNASTKSSLSLDGFLAIETGFTLEKESNTIAIICRDLIVLLAFDSREVLIQWQVKIKAHLTEEQPFLVQITNLPPKSKLSCGPARLHLQDHTFCLVSGIPPRLLGQWPIKELRRFGVIDGKFCFEGGSHCGKGAGLHVLHTNQSEELAKCFELALNGKLHRKRRLSSNKNSSIDGSVRMSLQQTKCHKSCECGSNESSRPLISSSSESSVCDACSEIIRFNSSNANFDNELISGESDEHYSSRSTCSTILRCSSNLSCSGGQPYMSSTSVAADNECFLTSHSLAMLNNCTDNRCSIQGLSNIDCNTLPKCTQNDNNRCSWALSPCIRCGHHYCTDINGCAGDEVSLSHKTLPNVMSAINLSELRSISPSMRDCFRHQSHQINNINKNGSILPDRASLCSQSSHSSGVSNSSNSSGSHSSGHSCHCNTEYSVPRTQPKPPLILDELYDKPKNFQHKICNIISKTEQILLCSCQLDQLDVTNKNTVTSSHRFIPSTVKANNLSENCNHLSTKPLKDINIAKCQQIEEFGEQHYAVPRTALANIYFKELKQSQTSLSDNMMKNIQNVCEEQYDIPRKYKESMSRVNQPIQPNQSIGCVCSCALPLGIRKRNSSSSFESNASTSDASTDTNRISNNNTVLTNNCDQIPLKAINQCLGGLRPNCFNSNNPTEPHLLTRLALQRVTISQQSECRPDRHSALNNNGNCSETIGVNKVRHRSGVGIACEALQESKTTKCLSKVNIVSDLTNGEQNMLTDCCLKAKQSTSVPKSANYVNMHFVQSLAFYENIECFENENLLINQKIKPKIEEPLPDIRTDAKSSHFQVISVRNDKNLIEKSINSIASEPIDNYMLMRPIMSNQTTYFDDKSPHKSIENILVNPSIQQLIETVNSNSHKNKTLPSKSSPFKTNGLVCGPVNHFKRRLSYRQRSNSSDRRLNEQKLCISSQNASSCPPSPALYSRSSLQNLNFFIVSKLSYKSKEKSYSIDDISLSNNHYLKFGHKMAFHKSADCLKQRTDDFYRSSEEDLCTSSQITVLCASPARASCLGTTNRQSNQVLSDSCDVGDTSSHITNGLKTESKAQKNLNECLKYVESTSSSDMSDYIETLSLSSRTSSGSDPTYVRSEDLMQKSLPINPISVEPKQEYLFDKQMIDCATHLQPALTHPLHSSHSTHSPSPGYESETSTHFL